MKSRIRIGIPSKGRLKSNVEKFFKTNSLDLIKNGLEREYVLNFQNRTDIQPVLMNASDIPLEIRKGNIDLGITGKDLLYEKVTDWSKTIIEIRQLNFGFANLVIAFVSACRTSGLVSYPNLVLTSQLLSNPFGVPL